MEMVGRYMMLQRSKQLQKVMNDPPTVPRPRGTPTPTFPGTEDRLRMVSHLQLTL
jgi:hypothetical protein